MNSIDQLIDLLIEIRKQFLSSDIDLFFSRYNSIDEVLLEIDSFIFELRNKNTKVIDELYILFAPTGTFQEISISNGWGERYILMSDRFDHIYKSIRN